MTGTNVIVTGAASGIGYAVAQLCAERGMRVIGLDVDRQGLQALATATRDYPNPAAVIRCDVTDEAAVTGVFREAQDTIGPVTGVVASAGVETNEPLHELSGQVWARTLQVNAGGVMLMCKHAIEAMRAGHVRGSIVCISSPAAFVGFAGGGNAAYAASKGAISALVRSAAVDYAADGIRVNAVVPGATQTPLLLANLPGTAEEKQAALRERAAREIPMQRLAQPREIAHAALWLLSDESSYVTGSHLMCDGGLLARSANTF